MFIFLQLMGDESALSENRIVRDEWWRDLRLALLRSFLLFWNGGCWESLVQSLIVRTLTVDIPSSVEGLDFS